MQLWIVYATNKEIPNTSYLKYFLLWMEDKADSYSPIADSYFTRRLPVRFISVQLDERLIWNYAIPSSLRILFLWFSWLWEYLDLCNTFCKWSRTSLLGNKASSFYFFETISPKLVTDKCGIILYLLFKINIYIIKSQFYS